LHGLGALPSRPQERLYSPHLPLNAELQRSGCVLRLFLSVQIAWNAADERHGMRVVDDALDVVEKELSAGIEVNAKLQTYPRSLAELSDAHVYLGALVEVLFRSKCRLVTL
jgi:hypothetical protein